MHDQYVLCCRLQDQARSLSLYVNFRKELLCVGRN